MEQGKSNSALLTSTTIREYFHEAVNSALKNQQLQTQDATAGYLVNLLCYFSRSDEFFERTPQGLSTLTLADLYASAIATNCKEERQQLLQRLGDIALFVAGIFSDSLNTKLVDVDYYIAMGGNAYSYLSSTLRTTPAARTTQPVFTELSERFDSFVDVLNEVSEQAHLSNANDVLRLYEVWVRTGSKRAAMKLQRLGIVPARATGGRVHH